MTHRDDWMRPFEPTRDDPFDLVKAGHLLRRAAFGASLEERERAVRRGIAATVDALFERGDGDDVDAFERVVAGVNDASALRGYRVWRLLRGRRRLAERMSHLWHDHFATSLAKVRSVPEMVRHLAVFDAHGLGRFDDLLLAVVQDPAMIRWLDNDRNVAGHPNENLARELFELFALGRGRGYTEHDIQEAARALTGWTVRDGRFHTVAWQHDDGEKELFGESGAFDGAAVVEHTVRRPESARFVAERLVAWFVHPEPTADEVAAVARTYDAVDRDLSATLKTLLRSRLFFSGRAWRSRIKDPADLAVGAVRSLGIRAAPKRLDQRIATMGLVLAEPPSVDGWAQERAWITSASWLRRASFAAELASGALGTQPGAAAGLGDGSLAERADRAVAMLLDGHVGARSRARLDTFVAERAPLADDPSAAILHATLLLPEAQLL